MNTVKAEVKRDVPKRALNAKCGVKKESASEPVMYQEHQATHKYCPRPSSDSYCYLEVGHNGQCRCKECNQWFWPD